MKATVTLREGKSYTFGPHVFTSTPSVITDRDIIAKLRTVGVLNVEVEEDQRVALPAGIPENEGEDEVEE